MGEIGGEWRISLGVGSMGMFYPAFGFWVNFPHCEKWASVIPVIDDILASRSWDSYAVDSQWQRGQLLCYCCRAHSGGTRERT